MKAATSGIGILGLFLDLFQSTPPVKAATQIFSVVTPVMPISIHAAREGGDDATMSYDTAPGISIHAAREGGDVLRLTISGGYSKFQSTPPVKAATFTVISQCYYNIISIHAAREGGDEPSVSG